MCRRQHAGDPSTSGAHLLHTPAVHASSKDASSPDYLSSYQASTSLVTQWVDHSVEPSRKSLHPEGPAGSSKATGVIDVPDEILEAILVHAVRGHGDLRTIAGTCRRWHAFSQLDCTWKRMTIRGWGHRADIVQVPIDKETNFDWKEYYKARLQTHIPELNYLRFQDQMTVSIRSILINWLLAVIDELQEDSEAAYLPAAHHQTVAYLDRYCASLNQVIETSELQMIGAACAVMALHVGKSVPDIAMNFFSRAAFYTDGACTEEQVQAVADKIMTVLGGEKLPTFETASDYIDELLTTMQKNFASSSTFCLAHYLGELALQAEASLKFTSREIGTAAYALACHTLGWGETLWMPIIKHHSPKMTLAAIEECMLDLHALLRQALSMLTRRNKRTSLPHVIVKYSRRERQHVAKVILTESPWPTSCPHGVLRETREPCQACIEAEEALELLGGEEGDDELTVDEEDEELSEDEEEMAEVAEQDEGQAAAVAGDAEAEAVAVAGAEEVAPTAAEEVAALALSSSVEAEAAAEEMVAEEEAAPAEGGSPPTSLRCLQVVLPDAQACCTHATRGAQGDQGGRAAVHTPVNASWLAPRAVDGRAGSGAGEVVAVESEGGDVEQEWGVNSRRCPEQQAGLQDVSFGVMSDACDNSFLSATSGEVADMLADDRRTSLGGDRRASMGSVLGAVFEEMPAVEDTMPFECASCPEGGSASRASSGGGRPRQDIGLKAMPGSGDGGEWGQAQQLGEGAIEVAAAAAAARGEGGGSMWL